MSEEEEFEFLFLPMLRSEYLFKIVSLDDVDMHMTVQILGSRQPSAFDAVFEVAGIVDDPSTAVDWVNVRILTSHIRDVSELGKALQHHTFAEIYEYGEPLNLGELYATKNGRLSRRPTARAVRRLRDGKLE